MPTSRVDQCLVLSLDEGEILSLHRRVQPTVSRSVVGGGCFAHPLQGAGVRCLSGLSFVNTWRGPGEIEIASCHGRHLLLLELEAGDRIVLRPDLILGWTGMWPARLHCRWRTPAVSLMTMGRLFFRVAHGPCRILLDLRGAPKVVRPGQTFDAWRLVAWDLACAWQAVPPDRAWGGLTDEPRIEACAQDKPMLAYLDPDDRTGSRWPLCRPLRNAFGLLS